PDRLLRNIVLQRQSAAPYCLMRSSHSPYICQKVLYPAASARNTLKHCGVSFRQMHTPIADAAEGHWRLRGAMSNTGKNKSKECKDGIGTRCLPLTTRPAADWGEGRRLRRCLRQSWVKEVVSSRSGDEPTRDTRCQNREMWKF